MAARHKDINQTTIMPGLVRAARMLLGWTQRDLASGAGVSLMAISRFEDTGEGNRPTIDAIHDALLRAGVHLFGDDTGRGIWQGAPAETADPRAFRQTEMSRRTTRFPRSSQF